MVMRDWARDIMFPYDWTHKKTKNRIIMFEAENRWVVEVMNSVGNQVEQKAFKSKDDSMKWIMRRM